MMTCSSKTPLTLDIYSGFESTDDDKTPEYPLSDDHPLSLINRTKRLNTFKSTSKYEIEAKPSAQGNNITLKQTNSVVDSSVRDRCRSETHDGHLAFASQQPRRIDSSKKRHLYSAFNILHGVMDKERRKLFRQKGNRKRLTEALNLASGPDPGFPNPKDHLSKRNVSLLVRSLIDCLGTYGVSRSYETGHSNFTNKLKASEQTNKIKIFSISSTDSNNNSGRPLWQTPKRRKELHTSIPENELSNRSICTALHKAPPNNRLNGQCGIPTSAFGNKQNNMNANSFEFNSDIDDKNTPPLLSPVIDLSPKSEATVNSQSPTFPPVLRPLIAESEYVFNSLEHSSVRKKSIRSQKAERPFQISPRRAIEASDTSLTMELSPDDSTRKTEINSPNRKHLKRTGDPHSFPSHSECFSEDMKENGREETSKHHQDQSPKWKKHEVPKLSTDKIKCRERSNCLPRHGNGSKTHACSASTAFKCSDLDTVPINKCPDITSTAVGNDEFKEHDSPSKPGETRTSKKESVPTDKKTKSAQTFLSTEAKSVTSSETSLCYPYSTQKSLGYCNSMTKESGPGLSVVQKSATIVYDGIRQAKTPLKERPPYSFIEKAFASPNVQAIPESFPNKTAVLSTPPFSLSSPSVPLIKPSSLLVRDFPTPVKRRSADVQFSAIVRETSTEQAPRYERVMEAVTSTAGLIKANASLPKVSANPAENEVFYTSGDEKRPSQKSYYVFAEWPGPSPIAMDWSGPENVLEFSDKFDAHDNCAVDSQTIHNATSVQTTGRGRSHRVEVAESISMQESCKTVRRSLWKLPEVQSPSDTSLKSNPVIKRSAHQKPTLRDNIHTTHDSVNGLSKFDRKLTDLQGPSSSAVSGTGQSEPLDLSSKPSPLHSMSSTSLEVMVKSTAKISPFVRFHQPENGKYNVFESKANNALADDVIHERHVKSALNGELTNFNNSLEEARKESSDNSAGTDRLVENSERDEEIHKQSVPSTSSSILQQKEADDLLPNEPNLVIDLDDSQMESSPLKTLQIQENRKPLPVDNYSSFNPDEKSYSHLAFAAITSKRKKSLASCMMPSENEDFLDFLRHDGSKSHLKERKKSDVDSTPFSRLRNGEFIDLTGDKEDVLSISSDDTIENMAVLYEPEIVLDGKNGHSPSRDETHETMSMPVTECCTGMIEDVNDQIRSPGLSHGGTTENAPELMMITNHQPYMRSCHFQVTCDESAENVEEADYPTWYRDSSAVFNDSKLSLMKEQSLAFSSPQKAKMARRIQDIISRNSKLLPEYLQQSLSGSFNAFASNFSERKNQFKSETEQSTPSNTEAGYSIPSLIDSIHDVPNSFSQHLKVKRSLSLDDAPTPISFGQPHQEDTALRCSSVTQSLQSSRLDLLQANTEDETAQTRAPLSSPRNNELNSKEPSPYKTVWQTQFFTENPLGSVADKGRNIAEKQFPMNVNNEDIVQRLELMHDASNRLNQSSQSNLSKESISGENSSQARRRRQIFTTDMVSQPSNEVFIDPLSLSLRPDSHCPMDNAHMFPSVSGQLNPFIPSPFVVAPYYAMAYPLYYPALQGSTTPNQPIFLSHHNGALDAIESRAYRQNGRKRPKKANPGVRPKRRRARKVIESTIEDGSNGLPQKNPQTIFETELNPVDIINNSQENVQNRRMTTVDENDILDTQSSTDLQGYNTTHHSNIQELLTPDYSSLLLKTRNEDGLTILSMQCAEECQSNDNIETTCNDQNEQSYNSVQHNSNSVFKPFSTMVESSAAKSWQSSVLDSSVSAQPVNADNAIGQNLATLALASETHQKIQSPASFQLGSVEKLSADLNPRRTPHSNLQVCETYSSPDDNVTTQNETQMLRTTPLGGEDCQDSQKKPMLHGITEKEKLVTEMLAAMMQNRKLTSGEKSSDSTNMDFC